MIKCAMQLDHPGHHRPAAGVDDRVVRRNRHLGRGADADDALAVDEDGGPVNRAGLVAVEQHAADQRQLRRLGSRRLAGCCAVIATPANAATAMAMVKKRRGLCILPSAFCLLPCAYVPAAGCRFPDAGSRT